MKVRDNSWKYLIQFQSYSRCTINSKWDDNDNDDNHNIVAIDNDYDDDKDNDDNRE